MWTYDLARATLSRLTTQPGADYGPLWTPDGQRIVFTSSRAGYPEVFWRSADGTGGDERLLSRKDVLDVYATSWSPDGMQLVFTELSQGQRYQCPILQVLIATRSEPTPLVTNEFCNGAAVVSPNGRLDRLPVKRLRSN